MRRFLFMWVLVIVLTMALAAPALAGSPHFVGKHKVERVGESLTVSGKIAGLGNEAQVEVEITVDAACINPGNNHPQAGNKESFAAAGTFPVQNGKAIYSLTVAAAFQPDCTPPMTVEFSNLVITDLTHGISESDPGPF